MFRHSMRPDELIAFEENTQKSIKLPRNRLIKKINLEFDPDVVVTGGSASGTVTEDALLLTIPKIEVVGNGLTTLFRMDAQALYYKNYFEHRIPGMLTAPADGSETTNSLKLNLTIHFGNNIGRNYSDTFLPANLFKSLDLIVSWGELDDMWEGTYDRSAACASSFGVRPVVYESTQPRPKYIRIQDYIEDEITATRTDHKIDMDSERLLWYQSLFFKTLDAGARASDIINYITLETDNVVKHINRIPYDQLRNENESMHQIDALPAGLVYLYLMEEGLITSALDVSDTKKTRLELDVTVGAGTTMLRVYQDKLMPIEAVL